MTLSSTPTASTTTSKRFLSYSDLADLMLSRNLRADKAELIMRLQSVNYYRLTGYLAPFRERISLANGSKVKSENYRAGTTLKLIWQYYLFDRRLRFLLIDAIERIEIALRTRIAHYWAEAEGGINPHALRTSYSTAFRNSRRMKDLLDKMQASYERSTQDCVMHHKNKGITDAKDLPIWVIAELTTIGELVWLYQGLKQSTQQTIAASFGFTDLLFFDSLLELLHRARNVCAHHSRVWNATWVQLNKPTKTKPKLNWLPIVKRIPASWDFVWDGNTKQWKPQVAGVKPVISKTSTAFLLMACHMLLRNVAQTSSWRERFMELMNHPETPYQAMSEMGLPRHWREHPLWQYAGSRLRVNLPIK